MTRPSKPVPGLAMAPGGTVDQDAELVLSPDERRMVLNIRATSEEKLFSLYSVAANYARFFPRHARPALRLIDSPK